MCVAKGGVKTEGVSTDEGTGRVPRDASSRVGGSGEIPLTQSTTVRSVSIL